MTHTHPLTRAPRLAKGRAVPRSAAPALACPPSPCRLLGTPLFPNISGKVARLVQVCSGQRRQRRPRHLFSLAEPAACKQGRAVTLAARRRFPPGRHSLRQTFHNPLALQRRHTCRPEVVCECFVVAGVEGSRCDIVHTLRALYAMNDVARVRAYLGLHPPRRAVVEPRCQHQIAVSQVGAGFHVFTKEVVLRILEFYLTVSHIFTLE